MTLSRRDARVRRGRAARRRCSTPSPRWPPRSSYAGARGTTRPQWHVTLQFLGNHADIDAVGDALEGLPVAPARVRLGGGGAFPKVRRGRVLWLGFREGADALAGAAREVERRASPCSGTNPKRARSIPT